MDILANEVNALIRAKKFDEAERACQRLLAEYPGEISGLRRAAQLEEARGNLEKAVEFYHRASNFAATHEGFDAEVIARYDSEARRIEHALRKLRADQENAHTRD